MGQVKAGWVYVVNGTNTVERVYEFSWSAGVGSQPVFLEGETCEWSSGNTGTITAFDQVNRTVRFYTTAGGVPPAASDTLTNTSSVPTRTVELVEEQSDPDWVGTVYSQTKRTFVAGDDTVYDVYNPVTSHTLTIDPNWAGETKETEYGVTIDFTPNGLPLPARGDKDIPTIVSDAFTLLDPAVAAATVRSVIRYPDAVQTIAWGTLTSIQVDSLDLGVDWFLPTGVITRPSSSQFQVNVDCYLRINLALALANTGQTYFLGEATLSLASSATLYLGKTQIEVTNVVSNKYGYMSLQLPITKFLDGDTFEMQVDATTESSDASCFVVHTGSGPSVISYIEIVFLEYA